MQHLTRGLFAAVVLTVPAGAVAQGTLVGDRKVARAWGDVYTEALDSDPLSWRSFMGRWVDGAQNSQTDWSAGAKHLDGSIDFSGHGLNANGAFDWRHGYDTGSPGEGGVFSDALFDGALSLDGSWDQSEKAAMSDVGADSTVMFTIDEPTLWTWGAHVEGASAGDSQAGYSFSIRAVEPGSWDAETGFQSSRRFTDPFGKQPFQVSHGRVGDFSEDVFLDGVLPAGTYMLTVGLSVQMKGSGFLYAPWSQGAASASMTEGVFHLGGGIPAPGAGTALVLAGALCRRRR